MIRRYIRERLFSIARHEVAVFLEEHEEELVCEFRKEIRRMDAQVPDEESFIDIRMVPLGETILRASLKAINQFLKSDRDFSTSKTAGLDDKQANESNGTKTVGSSCQSLQRR